jgi:hypothetical protein
MTNSVTTPLTAEQREELRRLEAAATPGPWRSMRDGNQYTNTRFLPTAKLVGASRLEGVTRPWNPNKYVTFGFTPEEFETPRFLDADADLIAAARNAMPALLASADRAEELEARNNAALDRLCYMQEQVDARRADLQRKGGQHVSPTGDFVGVAPSALGRIEWHIRAILDALGSGEGPAQYLEAELRKCQEEAVVMAKRVRMLEGLLGLALRWSVGLPRHMDERIRKALAQRQPEGGHR